MARARKGALIQCDPSIKALILQIDAKMSDIVLEAVSYTHLDVYKRQL